MRELYDVKYDKEWGGNQSKENVWDTVRVQLLKSLDKTFQMTKLFIFVLFHFLERLHFCFDKWMYPPRDSTVFDKCCRQVYFQIFAIYLVF